MERQFAAFGIGSERLKLQKGGTRQSILESYRDVDIALDTFPYGGGNTTAEAIWQGVPVLTLRGPRFSSAYGASLLKAAGCPELIADTADAYVDLAAALSKDRERLNFYRNNLRDMTKRFGLSDPKSFAAKMEDAYLKMAEDLPMG
jgi:predicted O-linked N-acetylglucosamine transferase (SPINDLY family)